MPPLDRTAAPTSRPTSAVRLTGPATESLLTVDLEPVATVATVLGVLGVLVVLDGFVVLDGVLPRRKRPTRADLTANRVCVAVPPLAVLLVRRFGLVRLGFFGGLGFVG